MNQSFRTRALAEMGFSPLWRMREETPVDLRRSADEGGRVDARPPAKLSADARSDEAFALDGFDLEELGRAIEACLACDRSEHRYRAVSGTGRANAMLMVVDEVPSLDASRLGQYLAADAARMLDQIFFALGLTPEQIYLSHGVRCDGVQVTSAHGDACSAYLDREIQLVKPRAMLALGSAAKAALQRVGKWSEADCFEIQHPLQMLANAEEKRTAWAVLKHLRRHLQAANTPANP